jgi:hypothetical protein
MVAMVGYLDQIARQKQRDVILIQFAPSIFHAESRDEWRELPERQQVLSWLAEQGIAFESAIYVADDVDLLSPPYSGQIYIDVLFDTAAPFFQKVLGYFEHPDGSSKFPGVELHVLTLGRAMCHAHRDEPGFLDKLI